MVFAVAVICGYPRNCWSLARGNRRSSRAATAVESSIIPGIWIWQLRISSKTGAGGQHRVRVLKKSFSGVPSALPLFRNELYFSRFWKGGESLPAQAGGGKSEHQRARCRVTCEPWFMRYTREAMPGGILTDSATENIPPLWLCVSGKGEKAG